MSNLGIPPLSRGFLSRRGRYKDSFGFCGAGFDIGGHDCEVGGRHGCFVSKSLFVSRGHRGGNSGGEFTAVTSPGTFTGNYTSESALNFGNGLGFEAFCAQVDVQFNTAQTYNYTLSQSMPLNNTTQPLTMGAAYLYSLFATGNASLGYDYVDPTTRFTDAGLLQPALWELEGGQTRSGDPFSPSNPYYTLALSEFGGLALARLHHGKMLA
jgi:hypothetical protein